MSDENQAKKASKTPATQGGVTASTKASAALGVLSAFVVAVLVNVLVARTYKRWDWTSSKLYTLSAPTKETLHKLDAPIEIDVVLSNSDPLLTSVHHLLEAYSAETDKLDIRYLDPDRHPAEFLAFQQKYGIAAGRTEDGRVVADTAIVVVKGDKKWFLTATDLVDFSEADEGKSRPKLEQGITVAIRNVLGGERSKVCFAKGHGELAIDDPGPRGLGELRRRLDRNNVDVAVIDLGAPTVSKTPWSGCTLAIVAGPTAPWAPEQGRALADFVKDGGAAFVFVNPLGDPDKKRMVSTGLEPLATLAGIEIHDDVVFERDPGHRIPNGFGESFFVDPKPSAITDALVKDQGQSGRILARLARSLGRGTLSSPPPVELLATTKDAFGMADFFAWNADEGPPDKKPGDREGPLAIAMAAELPKPAGSKDAHGPRVVIVGTTSFLEGQAWEVAALRGGVFFVESAISWLTSKPEIVDIPPKAAQVAGLRLTEESVSQVSAYVTIWIPVAACLVALSVYLRRRSTEKRRERGRT